MISEITKQTAACKYEAVKKQERTQEKNKTSFETCDAAVVELGTAGQDKPATYSKSASNAVSLSEADKAGSLSEANAQKINKLWDEANRATQNLRDMVEQLLKSQGKTFNDVLAGREKLVVDDKTRAAAEAAISEDGECGIKAVSDRIVAFAKAISNDNPEMYDKLMSAIDEGFTQVKKAFGSELPDICQKTHEEIKRKMDEWKASQKEETNKENDNIHASECQKKIENSAC